MPRKMIDCRDMPDDKHCSLAISGEEEEVVRAATEHAVSFHGYPKTPDLEKEIRKGMKDEVPAKAARQTG